MWVTVFRRVVLNDYLNQKVQFSSFFSTAYDSGKEGDAETWPKPNTIHHSQLGLWVLSITLRMKWSPAHLPLYPGYLDHSGPAGNFVLFPMATDLFPVVTYYQTRGKHNKFEIYSFTILEDRSLNLHHRAEIKMSAEVRSSRNSRKESPASSSSFLQLLPAVLGCLPHLCPLPGQHLQIKLLSFSLHSFFSALLPHTSSVRSNSLSLTRHLYLGLSTQITQANLLTSKFLSNLQSLCQIR